jgi:hypothetical protein
MKIKLFLLSLLVFTFFFCNKDQTNKGTFNIHQPDQSDRLANGGKLRFTLDKKVMHDDYFVAQFTPKGDMFDFDNLQLYNYNFGSEKYPQFIINIDFNDSELKNWEGKTFPMEFLAFIAAPRTAPFNSSGNITITKVSKNNVQGTFNGYLLHPKSKNRFPIKGEFKAIIAINV